MLITIEYDNNSLFNCIYSLAVGIAQENLLQVLQILLKAKLLTCADDESSLSGSSVIELFLGYKKYVGFIQESRNGT